MKISLVTDEISADVETAIELGVEWGVRDFELRGFGTERVPILSDFKKARLEELLDEYGVQVVAISPGLFKCPYPLNPRERFPLRTFDAPLYAKWRSGHDLVKYHLEELLPASIEYATRVKAGLIVIFSFDRGGQPAGQVPDDVLAALWQAADQAEAAGLQLAIEVEDQYWADTGTRTAELLHAIRHPSLKINWDPGNAFVAGDTPYPDGYRAIRDDVRHVHFKDVIRYPNGDYKYAIEGQVEWAGQIKALIRDGYQGYISIETHMQPKVKCARKALARLRRFIQLAVEEYPAAHHANDKGVER